MKKFMKFKRILPLFLAAVITLTALTLSASASDGEEIFTESAEVTLTDAPLAEDGDTSKDEPDDGSRAESDDNLSVPSTEESNDVSGETSESLENPFSKMYDALLSNSDKIFSLLAFIGTLIVGGAYKKGLIPSLTEALGKICSRIEEARADTRAYEGKSDEQLKNLSESVSAIESTLTKSSELLTRLDSEMKGYSEVMVDHEKMRTLFSYQIDMLYSIFMSSALPEYQKEEIGIKISKMREELASYEKRDE